MAKQSTAARFIDSLESRVLMSTTYSLLSLANLPGASSTIAEGLNDSGQVCGFATYGGTSVSFFRTGANQPIKPATDILGNASSGDAIGINGLGQVVGSFKPTSTGATSAFRTKPNGALASNTFSLPAGPASSDCTAIDDAGQAVLVGGLGTYLTAANGSAAAPVHITAAASDFVSGEAINNMGQVAGWIEHASGGQGASFDAFVYSGGKLNILDDVAFHAAQAHAINATGQICGHAFRTNSTYERAILWRNTYSHNHLLTSIAVDLGTLGGNEATAAGINNAGVIVGCARIATAGNPYHAYVYANNTMIDLNNVLSHTHGWSLQAGVAINNKGQILCLGTCNGVRTYCVLTPV